MALHKYTRDFSLLQDTGRRPLSDRNLTHDVVQKAASGHVEHLTSRVTGSGYKYYVLFYHSNICGKIFPEFNACFFSFTVRGP